MPKNKGYGKMGKKKKKMSKTKIRKIKRKQLHGY